MAITSGWLSLERLHFGGGKGMVAGFIPRKYIYGLFPVGTRLHVSFPEVYGFRR